MPEPILNLVPDGTLRYFVAGSAPWLEDTLPTSWDRNVPTWKGLYYVEARDAALAFLMAWKQLRKTTFRHVVLDTARMIAQLVYHSHGDSAWHWIHQLKQNLNHLEFTHGLKQQQPLDSKSGAKKRQKTK